MKKKSPQKPIGVYDHTKIEAKWQKKWAKDKIYKTNESSSKKASVAKEKFYILDMFPYPSGEGLHVGHPKGYIATDIISRMKRMQGKSVLHPMGFDAFGLPAENYALKTKTHPEVAVKKNVARYKKQLEILGFDYDWSKEVNTTDPKYYKWTQWIFLKLLEKGLAFESYEPINWCPSCKTGLANEDIEDGRCERCSSLVEKKPMRQWVLRITDYAERLLKDLDTITYDMPKLVDDVNPHQPGKPLVTRRVAHAIVFDPKAKKYLIIRNKKFGWNTVIIGGIEGDEKAEETARREVQEETGYTDLEFKRILGGVTEASYYTKHKGENRVATAQGVYFELKSDKRVPIAEGEDADNEIAWIDASDFIRAKDKMVNSELHVWLERIKNPNAGWPKPLLDWPHSIKELQKNWIGKSEGAEIDFRIEIPSVKTRFVIIHGYEGSAKTNFIPWLKKELEDRGHEVQTPELPNSAHPQEVEQVAHVLDNCTLDENTVVIGHSLGAIVAMKTIMKLSKPVSSLVLVAAAVDPEHYWGKEDSREYAKGFSWDFDYEKIKKLACGRIAILSDKREERRMPYLKFLSRQLSALLVETTSSEEHFVAEKEPAILESITPQVKVFTTRPDTLFGVTYIVLAPEHEWVSELLPKLENRSEVEQYINRVKNETEVERTDATKEKTGVPLKGVFAINPVNNEKVPVWIADYVLADYGTGAVMAVPAHDERDFAFAKKFGLPIKQVIAPLFTETTGPDAPRVDKKTVTRRNAYAIIKHWSENKYLCLDWKVANWKSFVVGGIEDGEKAIEACTREIIEETGYTSPKFVRNIGPELHTNHYAPHKDVNRYSYGTAMYFELKDGNKNELTAEETSKHEPVWVDESEVESFINLENNKFVWKSFKEYTFCYTGDGVLINSGTFSDKKSAEIKKEITTFAGGKWVNTYKLRDWVFSRQRYWGEPIPVIHCEKCGVVPVPEKDLPVMLPKVKSYEPTGTGESPLAGIDKWVNVKCPNCKGKAKRETNTMPQWAGSSWYYIAYCISENLKSKKPISKQVASSDYQKKVKYWLPVDMYVGGAEHATRHLIYARFWHKFLFDIGAVSTSEPFTKLQHVGLIMGEDGRKMSKRFGNVVNPDDIVGQFGADTMRVYEMFMGPFDQQIEWSTAGMVGSRRFIERVWKLGEKTGVRRRENEEGGTQKEERRMKNEEGQSQGSKDGKKIETIIHKAIKKVTEDIDAMKFNTAISTLMITVNELEKFENIPAPMYTNLLQLLAPFAPHITEELWSMLKMKKSIHISEWPTFDVDKIVDQEVTVIVQINGKIRSSLTVPRDTTESEIKTAVTADENAQKWLSDKVILKVIYVPNRLINFVVKE